MQLTPGGWGGGIVGSIFAGYVPLPSEPPYSITVYSVASYRPHPSDFWANVIFVIPTQGLKILPFLNPYLPEFS